MDKEVLTLTQKEVQLALYPAAQGPFSMLAKVPVLTAGEINVTIEPSAGGAQADSPFEAVVNAASFVILSDTIPETDRTNIEDIVREELLGVDSHPTITFKGKLPLSRLASDSFTIRGTLELRGNPRELSLEFKWLRSDNVFEARSSIRQSDFEIPSHKSFLGALRTKDELKFVVRVDRSKLMR